MGFVEKGVLSGFLHKIREVRIKDDAVRVIRFSYYRNFAAAEQELETTLRKPLLEYDFYGRGVYMALRGIIEAARAKDSVSYAHKLLNELEPAKRVEFEQEHESLKLAFDEYDLGFMDTWKLVRYVIADLKAKAPPPTPDEE